MIKKCNHCKQEKKLTGFFNASFNSRSSEIGTSEFCKQCHAEGKIKHGYGWYGDKYKSPNE